MDDEYSRCFLAVQNALSLDERFNSFWSFLVLVLVFIFINGFFSASEMAVVTLNDKKLRAQAATGDKKAARIVQFLDNQSRFLATIQVGVTLAGFMSAAFGADKIAPAIYALLDPGRSLPILQTVTTVVVTIIISFLSLVLGELVPKRIGMNKPEAFAFRFAGVLLFCERVFLPFTSVLNKAAAGIAKLLGLSDTVDAERVSEEEIRLLTEISKQSGEIHSEEAEMINKVFELDDKEVSAIMTPRTAVLALAAASSYETTLEVAAHGRFSRIPVYEGDIDNIIGILHIKDLLALSKAEQSDFSLQSILRPAYYVPGSKTVNVLIKEMRNHHTTLAIVIDEYGGTDGIISIEDVLEEIVGDIEDEYDTQQTACYRAEDGSYIFEARLTPAEAGNYIPELLIMEDDDDYDTMAGFVLSLLARIPEAGEHPVVSFRNLQFEVLEMEDRRIAKIRLRVLPAAPESER